MADAMAPPADSPVTNTRVRSSPCASTACSIIWRMEATSPRSRLTSSGWNQLKHRWGLLAPFCSGQSTANP